MGGKHPCETIFLYRGCVKSSNSPLCLTFDTPSFLYLNINICSQIGLKAVQRVCGNIDGYISTLGSNEYAHDIVAFEIVGDSLRPLYNFKID